MKFNIARASASYGSKESPCQKAIKNGNHWEIEISTLEELVELSKLESNGLVITPEKIWIYDDYLE